MSGYSRAVLKGFPQSEDAQWWSAKGGRVREVTTGDPKY
jgi:hypothetical protein